MFIAKDLRPMLATPPAQLPSLTVAGFVSAPKYDGIRAIVEVVPPTRPALSEAVAAWGRHLPGPVVLDGEVTALDAKGKPAGFERPVRRHT